MANNDSEIDTSDYSPLFLAIHKGEINLVKSLLNENSIEERLSDDRTPLHVAVERGNTQIVALLLEHGFSVDEEDEYQTTSLHLAVEKNCIEMVKLLAECLTVDKRDDEGETPLTIAVKNNFIEIVEILAPFANLSESFYEGSVLKIATSNEFWEIVKILLDNGADTCDRECTDEYFGRENFRESTPFEILVDMSDLNVEMVKLFLTHTYLDEDDIPKTLKVKLIERAVSVENIELIKEILHNWTSFDIANKYGHSILNEAAKTNNLNIIEILLDHREKAAIDVQGRKWTPLHHAASTGNLDMIKLFINYRYNTMDIKYCGKTPLWIATKNGHLEIIKYFIKRWPEIKYSTLKGTTLLHLSAKEGHTDILKYLIRHVQNQDEETSKLENLVHFAASYDHLDMLEYLIKSNSEVKVKIESGKSPLHLAVKSIDVVSIERLLQFGAKRIECSARFKGSSLYEAIEQGNDDMLILKSFIDAGFSVDDWSLKRNPLHFAAAFGHTRLVEMLIKAGADVNSLTDNSDSPLHFAATAGHVDIVNILLNSGAKSTIKNKRGCTPLNCALRGKWKLVYVSPTMFQNCLEIAEMLMRRGISIENNELYAAVINGSNMRVVTPADAPGSSDHNLQKNSSNTTNKSQQDVHFRPEIVRCLLNYASDKTIKGILNSLITDAIKSKNPKFIHVLLEYDVHKTVSSFVASYLKSESESSLAIIDHIEKLEISIDLLQTDHADHLETIVARFVLLTSVASDKNESCDFPFLESVSCQEWYKKCKIEISHLRDAKVHEEFNVTFYDILSKPVDTVANYLKSEILLEALESSYDKFAAYSKFLKRRVEKGKVRKELIESNSDFLLNFIKKTHKINVPRTAVDVILENLSAIDIQRLSSARKLFDKKIA